MQPVNNKYFGHFLQKILFNYIKIKIKETIIKNINFFHIVFETKYSRIKDMNKTIILDDEERSIVAKCIFEKSTELNFEILALSILPDHTHILIAYSDNDISNIVRNIKGSSSRQITKKRQITLEKYGRNAHIWSKRYYRKAIYSHNQMNNTIKYIQNQYIKHSKTWGAIKEVDKLNI